MRRLIALAVLALLSSTTVLAQRGGGAPRPHLLPRLAGRMAASTSARRSARPALWERRNEHLVINPKSYQADATKNARVHIDQVPLQPWARELTNYRHSLVARERAVHALQAGRRPASVHVAVWTRDRRDSRAQARLHLQHLERA